MRRGAFRRLAADVGWALGVVLLCLGVMALGAAVPERPWLVLCVGAAILVLGITALEPGVLPLVATVGVVVVYRVTLPEAGDLTVSDALLFAAVWPALVFARRGYSAPMRNLLWLAAAYQLVRSHGERVGAALGSERSRGVLGRTLRGG